MKVFELAKEFDLKALELIDKIKGLNLKIKNHMVELSEEEVQQIRLFMNPASSAPTEVKKKTVVKKKTSSTESAKADDVPTASKAKGAVVKKSVIVRRDAPAESTEAKPADMGALDGENTNVEVDLVGLESNIVEAPQEDIPPPDTSVEAVAPVAASPSPEEANPTKRPRYSVIRVVTAEPSQARGPLIVEEPSKAYQNNTNRIASEARQKAQQKSFADPALVRSAQDVMQEIQDEERNKKRTLVPRVKEEEVNNFKSTDFLRRERVYQPKKKKLSIGQNFKKTELTTAAAHKRFVEFDTKITVEALAEQMSVKALDVARKLKALGVSAPPMPNGIDFSLWVLDVETVELIAAEFQYEVRDVTFSADDILSEMKQKVKTELDANLKPRSPVITIMGHVDHGKTSLLDIIRRARVASGEAGGITQHIGAYTVDIADAIKNLESMQSSAGADKKTSSKKEKKAGKESKSAAPKASTTGRLTFLDTPGHEAFTEIRSRGAKVTDIAIIVVAASEGVMPQTREAVEHAKAAEVPIIVAMNKMDLPDANPDRCRQQLSEMGLISEEWGGETIFVPVSAKTGSGVDKLLEMIQLQAEVLELKAHDVGVAEGIIIEAKLDKGRGAVATVLVREGTLKVGDFVVCGVTSGKVRGMIDDKGKPVREATPSTPVEIIGLDQVPEAGDHLAVTTDEKTAKNIAEQRLLQKQELSKKGVSLEDVLARMTAAETKELAIILKADVKGSAEAIAGALQKLPADKVKIKLLSSAVGGISSNDVLLASASKAIILGFNVRPDNKALEEAERRGVELKTYEIIYNLIDDVRNAMEGLLEKKTREIVTGRAEVRNVFNITKVGAVAGCMIVKGKIMRSNMARLLRDSRVVYTGKLSGLKRFKDDAREVAEGFECGISIENYNDIKVGDQIECYMIEEVKQTLGSDSPQNANA